MTKWLTTLGCLAAMAAAGPALAWTATEGAQGIQISHQSNGLTVEMGCRSTRDGHLGFRITGLNATNIGTLTVRVYGPDGRAYDYDIQAEGSTTTVQGRLNAPVDFLDMFAAGYRLQFLADGVMVMDTDLDGTAAARSRIRAVCGF